MNGNDRTDQAMALFKQGDNRTARRLARESLAGGAGENDEQARDVLKRTGVDFWIFLPAAIGLVVWITELISM